MRELNNLEMVEETAGVADAFVVLQSKIHYNGEQEQRQQAHQQGGGKAPMPRQRRNSAQTRVAQAVSPLSRSQQESITYANSTNKSKNQGPMSSHSIVIPSKSFKKGLLLLSREYSIE